MRRFDFAQPVTIDEAIAAWEPGAAWLGGGTNLVDLMKTGALAPPKVIDITRLPGMTAIEERPDGSLRIGALVRNSDLADDAEIARRFPMVAEALLSGASGQLRNAATVGGNLMQRTRCAWFQDPGSACNRRDPGAGCDAHDIEGASLAVLGWSGACIATNPSDFCVPLAALDAVVELRGPDGAREIPLTEFHRLPGETPERETALAPGELIVALRLPAEAARFSANARYLKVRERTSFAFALVSAAAALDLEHGRIAEARLALGAVAAKPWRVAEAEANCSSGRCRTARSSRAPPRPHWPVPRPRRAIHGRSNSPAGLPPARSKWPLRERRRGSPHCPPPPSGGPPETSPMPDTLERPMRFGSSAGQPLTRRDGIAKVTGTATYAADNHPGGMLHAVCVPAAIARGRVAHLDVEAAAAQPGVVEVVTPANRPALEGDPSAKPTMFSFRIEALQDDSVRYAGQPIALVVGETLEAATEGARLLDPRYEAEPARTRLDDRDPVKIEPGGIGAPADVVHGDVEAGHAAAATALDATYETPPQYHNAMETHAIVAAWEGDRLTLDMPSQALALSCAGYAFYFGIPAENVTIRSPYLGGGFGSKAIPTGPQVLAILAARLTERPVKMALTRQQMFGPVGHRAATRQRLRLGADGAGALTVIDHDGARQPRPSRTSSNRRRAPRRDSTPPAPCARPTGGSGLTWERRGRCGRPARHRVRPRSNAPWTRWPRPSAWTRWSSG